MKEQLILTSELDGSFQAIKRFLQSDKNDKTVVLITTAAHGEGFEPDYEKNIKPFEELGYKVEPYDLAHKSEAEVTVALQAADVIYACGGNSFYLMEHMAKCNFKNLLTERLRRGAVYVGSSAGSIVCSPDITFIEQMDDPSCASEKISAGLGFIDVLFLPHLDHPFQGEVARQIYSNYDGETQLVALRDSQALLVNGKRIKILSCEPS